jgi:hypothetical protein
MNKMTVAVDFASFAGDGKDVMREVMWNIRRNGWKFTNVRLNGYTGIEMFIEGEKTWQGQPTISSAAPASKCVSK